MNPLRVPRPFRPYPERTVFPGAAYGGIGAPDAGSMVLAAVLNPTVLGAAAAVFALGYFFGKRAR